MADGVQLTGSGVQLVPDTGGGGGGGGTPGGPANSVQFNNNGALDGSAAFTFNGSTSQVAFGVRPTFAGNTPYDTANLDLTVFLTVTAAATTYLTKVDAAATYCTFAETDAKYLPFTGGALTGTLAVPEVDITGAPGTIRQEGFCTSGAFRWTIGAGSTAESGDNAGSNFNVWRFGDDGKQIDAPISIVRATGAATLTQRPMFGANTPWDSGNLDPAQFLSINGGTVGGNVAITGSESVGGALTITGAASTTRFVDYSTGNTLRWAVGADNFDESGSNAGSNYRIINYGDDGSLIGAPFSIDRPSSVATFSVRPMFGSAVPWDSINLSPSTLLPSTGGVVTGSLEVQGNLQADSTLTITGANGTLRPLVFETAGSPRWQIAANTFSESGGGVGSNLVFNAFDDSGTLIGTALQIDRNTSIAAFTVRPTFNGFTPWDSGNLVPGSFITQAQGDLRYLRLAGGSMTGPITNGASGPSVNSALILANNDDSGAITFYPRLTVGAFNGSVVAGDAAIIAGSTSGTVSSMVVGLWSGGGTGFRITPTLVAFAQRPTFAGNTPWDSANFSPANFLPLNGGTLNGLLTAPGYTLTAPAGVWKPISFNTGASQRWQLGSDNSGEGGSNTGSNFQLFAYADGGGVLFNPITVTRATGVMNLAVRPVFAGNTPWDSGNLASPLTTATAASTYLTIANAATMYFPLNGGVLHGPLSNLTAGNSQVSAVTFASGDNASQTNFYPSMIAGGPSSAGFQTNSVVQAGDAALLVGRGPAGSSAAITIGVASQQSGSVTTGSPAGIRISGNGSSGTITMGVRPTFAGNLAWDAGNFNASIYLTTASAATTYLTITNAAATYLTPAEGDARYLSAAIQEVVVSINAVPAKYVTNQTIYQQILKAPVSYGTNFGGGFAYCQIAPVSATTVFVENILADGTVNVNFEGQIGFAANSTVGTLSLAPGSVTLAAGTMIRFRASASPDSAFAGFMATLVGK